MTLTGELRGNHTIALDSPIEAGGRAALRTTILLDTSADAEQGDEAVGGNLPVRKNGRVTEVPVQFVTDGTAHGYGIGQQLFATGNAAVNSNAGVSNSWFGQGDNVTRRFGDIANSATFGTGEKKSDIANDLWIQTYAAQITTGLEGGLAAVRARYHGTNLWLKAPNGKPTNLTEQQWVDVRTPDFKNQFGDWEKAANIKKLIAAKDIVATGEEWRGKYELDAKDALRYALSIRGEFTNKDTGEKIHLARVGAKEVLSHQRTDTAHLKSVALIKQIAEESTFIEELPNQKNNGKFDSYRYYVSGLKMGGADYTVKMVVGVKDGVQYYDHELSKIEKGRLIDAIDRLHKPDDANQATYFPIRDVRLAQLVNMNLDSISTPLDENGEPVLTGHAAQTLRSAPSTLTEEQRQEITKDIISENAYYAVMTAAAYLKFANDIAAQFGDYHGVKEARDNALEAYKTADYYSEKNDFWSLYKTRSSTADVLENVAAAALIAAKATRGATSQKWLHIRNDAINTIAEEELRMSEDDLIAEHEASEPATAEAMYNPVIKSRTTAGVIEVK